MISHIVKPPMMDKGSVLYILVAFIFQACSPLNFDRRLDFVANEKKD